MSNANPGRIDLDPGFGYSNLMKTLEADEATENFTKVLDRVLEHHESFRIVKEGISRAYLLPAEEAKCDSHEFAADLADAGLNIEDRRALAAAIRKGRQTLKPIKNPWG